MQLTFPIRALQVLLALAALSAPGVLAQKVNVGYDKSVDFSRYKTYVLEQPSTSPKWPILYASVVGSINDELQAKGLTRVDTGGDLMLIARGAVGYNSDAGLSENPCPNCKAPLVDAQEWTGQMAPPGGTGSVPLPNGFLQLDFVDSASNKLVWSGRMKQQLDPEKKEKSLEKVGPAIKKLLAGFPPQKAAK